MRPSNKVVNIIVVLIGIAMFAGWSFKDISFAPAPSYTHFYQSGLLERLDVEGHAIEKHVGKSDAYLRNRLQTEDIPAASTFNDMAEADYAVRMVLSERQDLIQKWLHTGKSDVKAFYYPSNNPVGRILERQGGNPKSGDQVRVVLKRDNDYSEGFYIITAYPEMR